MEPWLRGGQGSKSQHLTITACEGAGHFSQLRAILLSTVIHSRQPATECLHVSCEGAQVLRGREWGEEWGHTGWGHGHIQQDSPTSCGAWWDAKVTIV